MLFLVRADLACIRIAFDADRISHLRLSAQTRRDGGPVNYKTVTVHCNAPINELAQEISIGLLPGLDAYTRREDVRRSLRLAAAEPAPPPRPAATPKTPRR
ncbi:hypothetical protein [Streptacidiphilus sp. MAP5-52]|uniref:hypothetical protein n=1 Tax=Streptacidiphilus sp. MAP5-52 TaxID=3156267 RepID=UPI0035187880